MDNRPIGIFDSGVGGLTCISHLLGELPEERVIYFGDTARTPYGSKTVNTIKRHTMEIVDFLVSQDVKMIVIACNTISCVCLPILKEHFPDIPIVGIVEPAAIKVAKVCDKNSNVGIIATKATISSGIYDKLIHEFNPNINVFGATAPMFVPLIEEGIINDPIMDLTIRRYMDRFVSDNKLDTLVLGCTHYPIIRKHISRLYPDLRIINPSYEIAARVKEVLSEKNILACNNDRKNIFYASDLSGTFTHMIQEILQTEETKLTVRFKSFEL